MDRASVRRTEQRRQGGNHLRTTTSDYGTNIRYLICSGGGPVAIDLGSLQVVYDDLRNALRASTGNSELLLKAHDPRQHAFCDGAA
jgi:hypothetical protein